MIDRLKALFDRTRETEADAHDLSDLRLAAAVLLVEAACLDDGFDEAEEAAIRAILHRHFDLAESEVDTLLAEATEMQGNAAGLVGYTRTIKDHFPEDERVRLMEMLWEVVYADGVLHDYEANLLRRIGGLLYVPDRDTGAARRRVLDRLGIAEDAG